MLHRLVISLIRVDANTFFRRIDVVGIENVPAWKIQMNTQWISKGIP